MRIVTSLIGGFVLGMSLLVSPVWAAPKAQDKTGVMEDAELGKMPYHVFVPAGNGKFPVILFLHGAGERGSDNQSQLKYTDHLLAETQRGAHKAIVIMPQCEPDKRWVEIHWGNGSYHQADLPPVSTSLQLAMKILDKVQAEENTDLRRVYVTGLSMGGFGTWDAITRYPDRFAAALPQSGGGNMDNVAMLKDKGIWAWHGDDDGIVPVSGSDDMVKAIEALGVKKNVNGNLVYTRVPKIGHWGWDGLYRPKALRADGQPKTTGNKGRDVYDWMFSFRLPDPASKPAAEESQTPATQPAAAE